ncbi:substrate-binding periplasmic protein [Fastidiosibacter lacustris]|uniref:substrate-binding periplasmic protein n=1 Tax=Fastidiosibacter lacustris TaxID=2056695 RepID=UPI0013004F9B|nr:transporter substrate-binding domain-containing protein [Fastidiosibacter lacustris]
MKIATTLVLLTLTSTLLYAKENNKISVDYALGDYYYPYIDKGQTDNGCLTRFVTKVFKSQGIELGEIRWLPWSVALKSLNYTKSAVVSFPWSYTKERAKDYLYSDILYTKQAYIWALTEQKDKLIDFTKLNGQKVCIPQGYGAYGQMKSMFEANKAMRITTPTMQDCFNQLKNKQVIAVYAGDDAMKNMKNVDKSANMLFAKAFAADMQTHYLIAGKSNFLSVKLISAFNKGLEVNKFDFDKYCKQ